MRAGCFAETRVIELMNRRFVNFYYNTGGPGQGCDAAASAFTNGKVKNRFAHFVAFTATGEPLGVTDVYASKDNTFDFLMALLKEFPEFDRLTPDEEATVARAAREAGNAAAQVAAGRLLEELGRYDVAVPFYRRALAGAHSADAYRGLLRMARYERRWDDLEALAREADGRPELAADLAAERAYRLSASGQYAEVRKLLEGAIKAHPDSKRHSELRFNAGVACFFLKAKDRAYYHWCWVAENLPDDRLARRCYIAAAHEGMPYPNPELGGFKARLPGGNIQVIQAAYERARIVYERQQGRD